MTNVSTLIRNLANHDADARRHAALALGASRGHAVTPHLIDRIRVEEQSCVREDLTWALVQHAEEASAALLAMLASPEATDRRTAAHVLSKVGDPTHFEKLAPLVGDHDDDVAIKAYRAVANTGHDNAAGVLATRLGDGDTLQRDALTGAMHRLGARAVPALIRALHDPDASVRLHAADTLGHLGSPHADAAMAPLAAAARDTDAAVRLSAVSALGQLGDVADDALAEIAVGDDRVPAQVARRFLDARGPLAESA